MVTNKIVVSGPRLHPGHEHPRVRQRTELRKYFEQFGKIVDVTVVKYDNSTVTFDNCESAAKCIQQRVHNIRGQDFIIKTGRPTNGMKYALKAQRDGNTPGSSSENAAIPNSQIPYPGGLTNRIFVVGPEKGIAKANQKEMRTYLVKAMRTYFGQFGQICGVSIIGKKDAKVAFDNCDSAARCIQQRNHTICGRDYVVHSFTPTNGMKYKIKTSTSTAPNLTKIIHVKGPCLHPEEVYPEMWQKQELGTYFSQFGKINSIAVSKKYRKSTVTFDNCDSVAKCIGQRTHKIRDQDFRVFAVRAQGMKVKIRANDKCFDKPGSASRENVSAPVIKSEPAAESNIGNQALQAPASSSSQVQESVGSGTTQKPWHKSYGLSSFDKPGYK